MNRLFILAAVIGFVAADWEILAKNLLTTELCVAFVNDQEGFVAGDSNGAGPQILKTTDGGQTWNPCTADFGIDILLLSCDAVDKTIVVSSIGGELYSDDDGGHFNHSIGGGLSQSVRYVGSNGDGGKKFATACGKHGVQGVGVSTDGGRLFKHFDAGLYTTARYVALPTDDVWYVAAGTFPNNNTSNDDDDLPPQYSAKKSEYQDAQGRFQIQPLKTPSAVPAGYSAQLAKTTDGGQTWRTLYAANNTFYFNGIDCNPTNPDHCCVTAEASAGIAAGARIMCTEDGSTFNTTFSAPATSGESYSLTDIRFVNETFAWAIGGDLTSVAPKAWFLQTNDGGKTWTHNTKELFGYYALGISVLSDGLAFAAVDDLLTQTSGVAVYKQ